MPGLPGVGGSQVSSGADCAPDTVDAGKFVMMPSPQQLWLLLAKVHEPVTQVRPPGQSLSAVQVHEPAAQVP